MRSPEKAWTLVAAAGRVDVRLPEVLRAFPLWEWMFYSLSFRLRLDFIFLPRHAQLSWCLLVTMNQPPQHFHGSLKPETPTRNCVKIVFHNAESESAFRNIQVKQYSPPKNMFPRLSNPAFRYSFIPTGVDSR